MVTEKGLGHFLTTSNVIDAEEGLHYFLTTLKVFNFEKGLDHFLETRKGFDFEKWFHHIPMTLEVSQNCWWTAASEGCLSDHIYD